LRLSVLPSAAVLRTLVVHVVQLLWAFKLFEKKKTDETFDDVKWMLTITQVAPSAKIQPGLPVCVKVLWPMSILT
jgi:hypothetical protein